MYHFQFTGSGFWSYREEKKCECITKLLSKKINSFIFSNLVSFLSDKMLQDFSNLSINYSKCIFLFHQQEHIIAMFVLEALQLKYKRVK